MSKKQFLHWLRQYKRFPVRVWMALTVLVCLLVGGLYFLFGPSRDLARLGSTYLDQLSARTIKEQVQAEFADKDATEIQDYAIYGETLTLYQSDYDGSITDASLGLNAVLKNVETGEETSWFFSGGADSGINLGELEPGVYEVYLNEQYRTKRVYFPESESSEVFTTVRRDGKTREVQLVADRNLFADQGKVLGKDYAFLVVTEQIPKVRNVDVIIDPAGDVYNDLSMAVEPGFVYEGQTESQMAMELGELVKERLEAAGLRVAFTRNADETSGYYGDAGRPAQGYDRQAKVFLNLSVTNEEDVERPYFIVSPYTSANLANRIASVMSQMGIELQYMHKANLTDPSVVYDSLQMTEDWEPTVFSLHPELRETGGKITSTGKGEVTSGNSAFSDAYGMYGLVFEFGNTASDESMAYYEGHKEEIADGLAQGILDYFEIGDSR